MRNALGALSGSLRLRLVLFSALTIAAALGLVGLALNAVFEQHLERRMAQELGIKLQELAGAFRLDEAGAPVLTKSLADPRYDQPNSGSYWQVSDANGPVLRSRSLWENHLAPDDPRGRRPEAYETTGAGGSRLFVRERDVRLTGPDGPRRYRLSVALDHAELNAIGASFLGDTLRALAVLAAVLVLGAWLQLTLGLAPLLRLQTEVARIRQGRSARLEGRFPREIAPLVAGLNELIDQQEDILRRARDRAGDLAHGLKTPLAILSGEARRLEEAGETAGAERLREQIGLMRGHVERQLARARSRGSAAAGGGVTDASASLERLLRLMRRMPRAEVVEWRSTLPEGLRLRMDPEDFGEVAGNLLDNARIWARSRILVSSREEAGLVRIMVEDDGPGIPPDRREALRGRGETAAGDGHGLGLAIVTDVLGLYGIRLEIGEAPGGGCLVAFAVPGWRD